MSAAGYAIFDRLRLQQEFTVGEIPGTLYGTSKKGWIDSELFDEWFSTHFLPHHTHLHLVLLYYFLMGTHPTTSRKAAAKRVILFCLPPHTTHLSQPLDRSCFSPLKSAWNTECQLFACSNPGKVVNRYNFTQLFSRVHGQGL